MPLWSSDIVRFWSPFRALPAALVAALAVCVTAAPATAQLGSELTLRALRVGPGGGAREGGWTGILVEYEDTSLATTGARDVLLRVRGVDVDGDPPLYERVVVAQGGQPRSAWLYTKLPMNLSPQSEVRLTAHAVVEAPGSPRGVRAGRELARTDVSLANVSPNTLGLIGVIGQRDLGLNQYAQNWGAGLTWAPLGHELDSVSVFGTGELPDRWHGLAPFGVLVWGTGQETDPLAVSVPRARAVRHWVERGGHLVVVLPSVGQAWFSAASNPLSGLLPAMDPPVRREGVDLERYRALLTQSATAVLPESATVHELQAVEDAGPLEAAPILEGPDGGVLALQRVVGFGRVTVIGLDLGQSSLASGRLPEAEAFWHRVLGRRGPVLSRQQAMARTSSQIISNAESRRPHMFDRRIDEMIDQRGAAALGVLLGTILFVVYWLVAGPVGFALLRGRRRKHAWVAYAGTAALFSVLAWSIAATIRPGAVRGTHVALLEQVHGSGEQRARIWSTVLIPWYGNAALSVGAPADATDTIAGRAATDLIAPFEPPGLGRGLGGFPDNRPYRIDARAPYRMTVPVRQTVKQVRADWHGRARWSLPSPYREPGAVEGSALRLEFDDRGRPRVRGRLAHDLPGEMRDVTVLLIGPQRPIGPAGDRLGRASIVLHGYASSPFGSGAWAPGEVLDVGAALRGGPGARSADTLQAYLDGLAGEGENLRAVGSTLRWRREDMLEWLLLSGLIRQMGVPDVARNGGTAVAQRVSSHGWDLGPWFTRPCLIVTGIVRQDEGEPPAPLRVDGEAFDSRGDTVVRWIYPFEAHPPGFETEDDREQRGAGGDPGGG